jgi:two-component system OmpR family response regulator
LNHGVNLQFPESQIGADDFDRLSNREKEALALIAKNCMSKEIAQHLSLSLRTIRNHRVNICKKLRIAGPNALLKVAIENQTCL